MSAGIYKIENIITGKAYIGQSFDTHRRLNAHKNKLLKGCHVNIHLQNSWIKYGEENFDFIILEELPKDKSLLTKQEQFWMDHYNSIQNGYNIWSACDSTLGYRHTDETKQIIGEIEKKSVLQFTLEGVFLKRFDSCIDAMAKTGVFASNISCCSREFLLKRIKSSGNFLWVYEDDFLKINKPMKKLIKIYDFVVKERKKVVKLDNNFKYIDVYDNLSDAARSVNGLHCAIREACNGLKYKVKGFYWIYEDDFNNIDKFEEHKNRITNRLQKRTIYKINSKNEILQKYESIAQASKDIGIHPTSIGQCLKGISKTSAGFKWKYADTK